MTNYLLCCDWGTSSFRLQLVDIADYRCLGEIQSPIGVAATFNDWRTAGEHTGLSREQFFRQQLSRQIDLLAANLSMNLRNIPIVMSGMASSSIGMAEVPYARLPFAVDGSQASVRRFAQQPDFLHEILLISGVRSQYDDVMRGEETQLIGLMALLDKAGDTLTDAICIFPGTHSKHLSIQNRKLTHFRTYMTGEVFDLMARQSILTDSVDSTALSDGSDALIKAFNQGVRQARSSIILNSLFTVRTNQLFNKLTKKQNAFYLSGLLIGTELSYLLEKENLSLVLCSGSTLSVFYKLALDELQLTSLTRTIPTELIDKAASIGQMRLFQINFYPHEPT